MEQVEILPENGEPVVHAHFSFPVLINALGRWYRLRDEDGTQFYAADCAIIDLN